MCWGAGAVSGSDNRGEREGTEEEEEEGLEEEDSRGRGVCACVRACVRVCVCVCHSGLSLSLSQVSERLTAAEEMPHFTSLSSKAKMRYSVW